MDELKPCPFCGGIPRLVHRTKIDGRYFVECSKCDPMKYLYDTIDEVSAAWNRRADGWIKTSDRLPEDGEMVLAWNANRFGVDRYVFAEFDSEMGFIYSNLVIATNVTHWQPLPKPPTGEPHDDQV